MGASKSDLAWGALTFACQNHSQGHSPHQHLGQAHATDKQGVDNSAREVTEAGQLVKGASLLPQWLTLGAGTFSAMRRWSVSSACVTVLRQHSYRHSRGKEHQQRAHNLCVLLS